MGVGDKILDVSEKPSHKYLPCTRSYGRDPGWLPGDLSGPCPTPPRVSTCDSLNVWLKIRGALMSRFPFYEGSRWLHACYRGHLI